MCKNNSWKIRTGRVGFGNSDAPGKLKGEGWFEDPRFWRESFVDGSKLH